MMVALSFGCITHQMKFPSARGGNLIELLVKKNLLNFSLKVAKQAAAMTAWSATVLQHNAKIFKQYEIELKY